MTTSSSAPHPVAGSTDVLVPPSSLRTPARLWGSRDIRIHPLSTTVLDELAKPEGHGLPPMPPRWWEQFDHPGTHQRDWERRSTG